jgi:glyoxylate reductase
MSRVVITKAVPDDLVLEVLVGIEVTQGPAGTAWGAAEVRPHLTDCEALVTWGFLRVDEALLDDAPRLRIVANVAVGYDNLDVAALERRGIWATNTPTDFAVPTAEVALGLMISVMRRIAEGERYVRAGAWQAPVPGRFDGPSLAGKRLGLVGFGAIAREVAVRARAFGMDVTYHARRRAPGEVERALGATWLPFDDLLATADVLSLHVPLTDQTRHLIDAAALARMKPSAYLVNTARGKVVDEAALIRALRDGGLAGAGLDVFEGEPEVPGALLELPNVAIAPHLGGASIEGRRAAQRTALANVLAVLRDGDPLTPVNRPGRGEGRSTAP